MFKVGEFVRCKKDLFMNTGEKAFTKGNFYKVEKYFTVFEVRNNKGNTHSASGWIKEFEAVINKE